MDDSQVRKRPTISLSLLTTLSESFSPSDKSPNSIKSPRYFEDAVVGLGIVAAMTNHDASLSSNAALSPRSNPIPIVSSAKPAANFLKREEVMVDESSEGYTCVISHLPNNSIKKRVYFDDELNGVDNRMRTNGVFSTSPVNFGELDWDWTTDFLNSCNLCRKQLQGVDIFIYRGDRAFCSEECRETHIRKEEYKEKRRPATMKPLDCSISSCSSGPLVSFAGVVAA